MMKDVLLTYYSSYVFFLKEKEFSMFLVVKTDLQISKFAIFKGSFENLRQLQVTYLKNGMKSLPKFTAGNLKKITA